MHAGNEGVCTSNAHTERGVALVMKAVLSLINACWDSRVFTPREGRGAFWVMGKEGSDGVDYN